MDVGVDAYVSVEEVSAYLTARGQQAAWAAAEPAAQEAAIIEATSFLDAAFSWVGKLEDLEQTLGWPRACATDREGRTLTGIPMAVKNATSELARSRAQWPPHADDGRDLQWCGDTRTHRRRGN
ncbi:MAG: DnaT-like ssDNA-binding protein [Rhizobiaceae bacterium]